MARITVDPTKVQGKILLDLTSQVQRARAQLHRVCDIMDQTRSGSDFTPLGAALGCTGPEAATIYSRYTTIRDAMDAQPFPLLAEVDQG